MRIVTLLVLLAVTSTASASFLWGEDLRPEPTPDPDSLGADDFPHGGPAGVWSDEPTPVEE